MTRRPPPRWHNLANPERDDGARPSLLRGGGRCRTKSCLGDKIAEIGILSNRLR